MTKIARRDLLAALAALGVAGPALAAEPNRLWSGAIPPGALRIGQAWLAQHPGHTAAALAGRLAPDGWSAATVEKLRLRVATDFRQGRVFQYRGWRLSDTEGALFALTVLSPA
ncbi:hypothetical protein [Caulobacter sp. NIBR1757]|uniref:hypothetical protein n=1 Tax=Caulobacter sp. NIBR1757 TaxID=3016000 RepID=UPI0022F109D2|nr:hypothetical protein [Caulobacter sp. NIBR1757]WGM39370.1 hypothetical protein AMEJIAPC_02289 [Caulobacter sp. NIBR1757]